MGLFDMFKKKDAPAAPATPATPASVEVSAGPDELCAPVTGKVIAMSEVPDPVFSGEVLGKGCAVWPEGDVVYAPVTGEITVTMGHAVGINSDNGIEVLVHVGVDTVNLHGRGFTMFVRKGDRVKVGQPVIEFDQKLISERGLDNTVIVTVTNADLFSEVRPMVEADVVEAGSPVLTAAR